MHVMTLNLFKQVVFTSVEREEGGCVVTGISTAHLDHCLSLGVIRGTRKKIAWPCELGSEELYQEDEEGRSVCTWDVSQEEQ